MKKKKPSKMIMIGAVAVALIFAAIVVSVFAAGGGSREYDNHLEMAQKYLDELNYEQAVVELRMVIEIKPKDSAAYFALADVYVALGDYGNAMAVLEEGYVATGDEELSAERERIAEEYAKVQEQERIEQEQKEREQRIEEFYEKYAKLDTFVEEVHLDIYSWNTLYLTFAEREQAYGGLAEQLEQYLADLDGTEGLPEERYDDERWHYIVEGITYLTKNRAYECLADIYLCMGKLEECLRVRTEWAEFCDRPDLVQDGNYGYYYNDDRDVEYDRYGRITFSDIGILEFIYVYEEPHDGSTHTTSLDTDYAISYETDYTYDSEGRIMHEHTVVTDNWGEHAYNTDYIYTENRSFVKIETRINRDGSTSSAQYEEQFYDEYGREIP